MVAFSVMLGVLATASVAHAGIYPDGHWDTATELTTSNADDFVKTNVDAGKTVFAPAWNAVTAMFKGNDDVAFGDVVLSSNQVRSIHGTDQGAGAGGWPTVRIFNKETGYGGKAYEKKTSEAMCDELGPKNEYMQQLVEEYASLCSVQDTSKGCTDKQKDFIAKWAEKPMTEVKKQLSRLEGMAGGAMKPEAAQWLKQRLGVFKQLIKRDEL